MTQNNANWCCADNIINVEDNAPVLIAGDPYEGSYLIIPKTYDQDLPTEDKYCDEDIIVKEIPYSEAENQFGGNTVSIACS